ncbi:MAG TPA: DUF2281 domain-containing protein [Gemmatimonadaceae bacterium]|nr:DUF2281 domain-containing protein [Gemmatimonadaceae bacterium]
MNPALRDRILRKLDELPDDRGYQLLDYIEFLESKYAGKTAMSPNAFERFAEGVEDTLRAGKVSASTIAETMGLLNRAVGVLSGVAATGQKIATDALDAAARATGERKAATAPAAAGPPASPAASPAAAEKAPAARAEPKGKGKP